MYVTTPISCFQNVFSKYLHCNYCERCSTVGWNDNPFCSVSAVTDLASLDLHIYMDSLGTDPPPLETPQFNSLLWRGHTKN